MWFGYNVVWVQSGFVTTPSKSLTTSNDSDKKSLPTAFEQVIVPTVMSRDPMCLDNALLLFAELAKQSEVWRKCLRPESTVTQSFVGETLEIMRNAHAKGHASLRKNAAYALLWASKVKWVEERLKNAASGQAYSMMMQINMGRI